MTTVIELTTNRGRRIRVERELASDAIADLEEVLERLEKNRKKRNKAD